MCKKYMLHMAAVRRVRLSNQALVGDGLACLEPFGSQLILEEIGNVLVVVLLLLPPLFGLK